MAIGDVITILRDGKFQAEARVSEIDVPWIVREMLGSDPVSHFLPRIAASAPHRWKWRT